ncbi:MAG: hypothetical protein WBC53_10450 [Phycisphaerae bacterium]
MNPDDVQKLKNLLYELVPADGQAAGNVTLRKEVRARAKEKLGLDLSDEDYWLVHGALHTEGKVQIGRGYGGSLRRTQAVSKPTIPASGTGYKGEFSLYKPFLETIQRDWARQKSIPSSSFVAEVTAQKGSKDTGGRWTRPDVTLIAVRTYPFVPGKALEVITFEIKPLGVYSIEGVFETASHSTVANRSYLCFQVPKDFDETLLDRVQRTAERFGVGVITFVDPSSFETFNTLVEAEHQLPDPAEMSSFIGSQIGHSNQLRLQELIR